MTDIETIRKRIGGFDWDLDNADLNGQMENLIAAGMYPSPIERLLIGEINILRNHVRRMEKLLLEEDVTGDTS